MQRLVDAINSAGGRPHGFSADGCFRSVAPFTADDVYHVTAVYTEDGDAEVETDCYGYEALLELWERNGQIRWVVLAYANEGLTPGFPDIAYYAYVFASREAAIKYGLTDEAREALGVECP